MKRAFLLKYQWTCVQFPDGDIPKSLAEALEESAEKTIAEFRERGFISGELHDEVNMFIEGVETPKDGFECRGWFEITPYEENSQGENT
jgi:hypothetical protein